MPPSPKILQLRQLLSERFPGVRFTADALAEAAPNVYPTGLKQIDQLLRGGLPKGATTEIVTGIKASGSALLISALLRKAAGEKQIVTLIDGADSFDPAGFEKPTLARLLWVRCKNTNEALKAVDLVLRDRNLSFVLLDLQINSAKQLRKIPSSTWYRLQRIVEAGSTTFVVFTPSAMVGCAQVRLNLQSRFALEAMQKNESELLQKLKVELTQHRLHVSQPEAGVAKVG